MDGGEAGVVIVKRSVAAALLLLASGCATVTRREPAPKLWSGLERGRNAVGFRTMQRIAVWYPAASGGESLRFRDYAGSIDELEKSLHAKHMPDDAIGELFDTRMLARRDATAIDDKRPVVTIVTGDGESAADYAVLGEFLASHGYVVAAAPAKANIDALPGGHSSLFLHNVDVTTWTFVSSPADAKRRSEKILAFVANHFAR